MQRQIAFIGSRDLGQFPSSWVDLYQNAVVAAVQHGHTIVTGAAEGADQLAAETALQYGGTVRLILPWASYERDWWDQLEGNLEIVVYNEHQHPDWTDSVYQFHPAANRLTRGPFALHARNYGILELVSSVVALPSINKPGGGGTGQGIRIATSLEKRLFDLSRQGDLDELTRRLDIK